MRTDRQFVGDVDRTLTAARMFEWSTTSQTAVTGIALQSYEFKI